MTLIEIIEDHFPCKCWKPSEDFIYFSDIGIVIVGVVAGFFGVTGLLFHAQLLPGAWAVINLEIYGSSILIGISATCFTTICIQAVYSCMKKLYATKSPESELRENALKFAVDE